MRRADCLLGAKGLLCYCRFTSWNFEHFPSNNIAVSAIDGTKTTSDIYRPMKPQSLFVFNRPHAQASHDDVAPKLYGATIYYY